MPSRTAMWHEERQTLDENSFIELNLNPCHVRNSRFSALALLDYDVYRITFKIFKVHIDSNLLSNVLLICLLCLVSNV